MLSREYDRAVVGVEMRCQAELGAAIAQGMQVEGDGPLLQIAMDYMADERDLDGLSDEERRELARFIIDDLYQLGPLEELLADTEVSEIMVNAPDDVRVERAGRIVRSDVHFFDDSHIERMITKIVQADGRHCDTATPMCDCTLHRAGATFDGSRVNCVWHGISVDHPLIDIRKFRADPLTPDKLVALGSMDERCVEILEALVRARMNMLVVGGTGTGKTTLLNALSSFIPDNQRILTIEDTAELSLNKDHVVRLEARQASTEGTGAITIRQLIVNSLRMRPDRIVVGECRGAEAFDMLQAMSTGHDGSLTTLHANDPVASIQRLQMCVQMSEAASQMPADAIRQVITDAIDFIVHIRRYQDGSRRVASISEVVGLQGPTVTMGRILTFRSEGVDSRGRVVGRLVPGGDRFSPSHMEKMKINGVDVKEEWFREEDEEVW